MWKKIWIVLFMIVCFSSSVEGDEIIRHWDSEDRNEYENGVYYIDENGDAVIYATNGRIPDEIDGHTVTSVDWWLAKNSKEYGYELRTFYISEENSYFSEYENALLSKDGSILIAYPYSNSNASYSVPDSVDTIIGYAFFECNDLQEIILPNGLKTIQSDAIHACYNLHEIFIPESVEEIRSNSIKIDHMLEEIDVDPNNPKYASIDGILFEKDTKTLLKCPGNKRLDYYEVPDGIKEIDNYAFMGCNSLTEISFPDSLETIGWWAFVDCVSLESIEFSDNVNEIGWFAFMGCSDLEEIYLPDSVTEIGEGAFSRCENLIDIRFPAGIKRIPKAFYRCNLLSVFLPPSVEEIEDDAFEENTDVEFIVERDSYAAKWVQENGFTYSYTDANSWLTEE